MLEPTGMTFHITSPPRRYSILRRPSLFKHIQTANLCRTLLPLPRIKSQATLSRLERNLQQLSDSMFTPHHNTIGQTHLRALWEIKHISSQGMNLLPRLIRDVEAA